MESFWLGKTLKIMESNSPVCLLQGRIWGKISYSCAILHLIEVC